MRMKRQVIAQIPEPIRDTVQAAYYKKMSTLDTINYLASNGGYGDNKEYLEQLEFEKLRSFSAFSVAFEKMCNDFAPGMNQNVLKLDFNSSELYIEVPEGPK